MLQSKNQKHATLLTTRIFLASLITLGIAFYSLPASAQATPDQLAAVTGATTATVTLTVTIGWFGSMRQEAIEIARKFVYASRAGQHDLQLTTPGLKDVAMVRGTFSACVGAITDVQVGNAEMSSDRGIKIHVPVTTSAPRCRGNWDFFLERISNETKIVRWKLQTNIAGIFQAEDPQIETFTLARFGLPSSLPQPAVAAGPLPMSSPVSFSVAHRHIALFGPGSNAQYSCSGTLSVSPDGTVSYDCAQTDDPSGRCDHLSFASGSLKQVKIGFNGNLHLVSKRGNFDFFGDGQSIKQAQEVIAPLVQK